jgi:uncharacterized protein (TIGR00251 family)
VTERPWRAGGRGLLVAVKATPRANRTEATGVELDGHGRAVLRMRVKAPPVDGAANKAILRWFSDTLAVSKSSVAIASGETARIKQVELAGNAKELAENLEAVVGETD